MFKVIKKTNTYLTLYDIDSQYNGAVMRFLLWISFPKLIIGLSKVFQRLLNHASATEFGEIF